MQTDRQTDTKREKHKLLGQTTIERSSKISPTPSDESLTWPQCLSMQTVSTVQQWQDTLTNFYHTTQLQKLWPHVVFALSGGVFKNFIDTLNGWVLIPSLENRPAVVIYVFCGFWAYWPQWLAYQFSTVAAAAGT